MNLIYSRKEKLHTILSNPKEKTMTTPLLEIGKTNTRRTLKEKLTFSLRGETNILFSSSLKQIN